MGDEPIKVIHIDTEMSWRGGQQQAAYLFEGMLLQGCETLMLCQPGSAMQKYCLEKKLPHRSMSFPNELSVNTGRQTARLATSFQASILHLHSGHSVSWGLWAKLFSPSLRLIATRRVDFSIRKNPLSVYKYRNPALNHIVCISANIFQVMRQDGISDTKLSVIRSSVDIHRFDHDVVPFGFRKTWNIPDDNLLIGTVAAFVGHKDYPNLLRAARIVLQSRANITFMAVGEGALLDEMRAMATELQISDRFIFAGFQKQVGIFLKAFDIFVLASKLEGLGTSVLDAMSVGLPIIGTRAGGIPEMIKDAENGLLVPAQDHQALADAILKLADNPFQRGSLALQAQSDVHSFSVETMVRQYLALYESLL